MSRPCKQTCSFYLFGMVSPGADDHLDILNLLGMIMKKCLRVRFKALSYPNTRSTIKASQILHIVLTMNLST